MDVEIFKSSITMQTCANCRYSYEDQLHSSCPICCDDTFDGSIEVDITPKLHFPSFRLTRPVCAVYLYDLQQQQQQAFKRQQQLQQQRVHHQQLVRLLPPRVRKPLSSSSLACNGDACVKLKLGYHSNEVEQSMKLLKMCGWYHERLVWEKAIDLLMPTPVGTFLVRDSSDSNFLYSLSVQTKCGPTSVRIHYANGLFRLDADQSVIDHMPKYNCLIKLIQSYIESTKKQPLKCSLENEDPMWVRCVGKIYSNIVLTRPIYPKGHLPSLKHFSRLCVNRHLLDANFNSVIPAPLHVVQYLLEYPYKY